MQTVAEIVTFTLIADTDQASFLTAAAKTHDLIAAQPGFLSRHLSKGDNGTWTDYVLWSDMATAQAAPEVLMQDPDFLAFISHVEQTGLSMRHETLHPLAA